VTAVPTAPELGLKFERLGAGVVLITVKLESLLACPPTITTRFPVTAPAGTGTSMLFPLQFVGAAFTPPNVIVLVPCVAPKFAPEIVTSVPTFPEPGLTVTTIGATGCLLVEVAAPGAVIAHEVRAIVRATVSNSCSKGPH
jgi:DNA-binding transcriptional regulator YdaS (Cro superfamily)